MQRSAIPTTWHQPILSSLTKKCMKSAATCYSWFYFLFEDKLGALGLYHECWYWWLTARILLTICILHNSQQCQLQCHCHNTMVLRRSIYNCPPIRYQLLHFALGLTGFSTGNLWICLNPRSREYPHRMFSTRMFWHFHNYVMVKQNRLQIMLRLAWMGRFRNE